MMAGLLASVIGVAAIVLICLVLRAVNRTAEATFGTVVCSPANDALTSETMRVVVSTVLALDDEMLVELQMVKRRSSDGGSILWLHSPTNVASIITLTRWRDACSVVEIRNQPHGVVLLNDQARVSLPSARADLAI